MTRTKNIRLFFHVDDGDDDDDDDDGCSMYVYGLFTR